MTKTQNNLYPVFFRLERLKLLIVGAGEVGREKLFFIYKSSPNARVTILADRISPGVRKLTEGLAQPVNILEKTFTVEDVINYDLIIAATNDHGVNLAVYRASKYYNKIVNVADTPDLCDFYMGSIVNRGDLKIAISTNGKSPTFAKRLRQVLEETLPNETAELLTNLKAIRDRLGGNFAYKVQKLNRLTQGLLTPAGVDFAEKSEDNLVI